MHGWRSILKSTLVVALLSAPLTFVQPAQAQVSVAIGIGPVYAYPAPVAVYGPPVCQWGYYPYYPYACAPYGYYGDDWFDNGIFIGAGPWFRGWYGRPWGWGYNIGYYGWYGPRYWYRDDDDWRGGYGYRYGRRDGYRGDRARYYGGAHGGTYFGGRPNYRNRNEYRTGRVRAGNGYRITYGDRFRVRPARAIGTPYRGFHSVSNFGGVRPARNFGGRSFNTGRNFGGVRPARNFGGRSFHAGRSFGGGRSFGRGGFHGAPMRSGGGFHGGGHSFGGGGFHSSGGFHGGGFHGGGGHGGHGHR